MIEVADLVTARRTAGSQPRLVAAARVRVLLVDRELLFSRGLQLLLPEVSDNRVQVTALCDSGEHAISLVAEHHPDLVLVDLDLGAPGGIATITAIRNVNASVPVVAMSPNSAQFSERARAALRAGAYSVICKDGEPEELLAALLAAADGWAVLPVPTLDQMVTAPPQQHRLLNRITTEERLIWTLIALGASTREIGTQLHVSERTVKRLTAKLLCRLGVTTRTEAAALAGRNGLIDAEQPRARPRSAGSTYP